MDKLMIFVAMDDIRESSEMLTTINDPRELKQAVKTHVEFTAYRLDKIQKSLTYPRERAKYLNSRIKSLKKMMTTPKEMN